MDTSFYFASIFRLCHSFSLLVHLFWCFSFCLFYFFLSSPWARLDLNHDNTKCDCATPVGPTHVPTKCIWARGHTTQVHQLHTLEIEILPKVCFLSLLLQLHGIRSLSLNPHFLDLTSLFLFFLYLCPPLRFLSLACCEVN